MQPVVSPISAPSPVCTLALDSVDPETKNVWSGLPDQAFQILFQSFARLSLSSLVCLLKILLWIGNILPEGLLGKRFQQQQNLFLNTCQTTFDIQSVKSLKLQVFWPLSLLTLRRVRTREVYFCLTHNFAQLNEGRTG